MATETVIQQVGETPEIEAYRIGLLKSAKELADKRVGMPKIGPDGQPVLDADGNPVLELPGQKVAGFSGLQSGAFGRVADYYGQDGRGIAGYQPYMQRASQNLQAGAGSVGSGIQTLGSALSQLPEAQQAYARQQQAMLDAQRLGQTGVGQAQAETAGTQALTSQAMGIGQQGLGQAQDLTRSAMMQSMMGQGLGQRGLGQAQQMTAGAGYEFDPTSYRDFMDPYMEDIVQQQYADIAEQGDIAKNRASAQAVGAGAFGGSRGAIEQAAINQNVLEQQARTGSQLRSQGFQQAQNIAQQAAARQAQQRLAQAGQYGQLAGQAGALGLQGAGQYGQLAGQIGQQAGQMAGLGFQGAQQGLARAGQMGQLAGQAGALGFQGAQGYGQQAAGIGTLAQLAGQIGESTGALGARQADIGTKQAALGELGQAMLGRDAELMYTLGGRQQAQQQAELEAQRSNQMAQLYEPYQRLGFLSDIYKGTPTTQQTVTQSASPNVSPFQQYLGLGIAGLSAGAGATKAGLFG